MSTLIRTLLRVTKRVFSHMILLAGHLKMGLVDVLSLEARVEQREKFVCVFLIWLFIDFDFSFFLVNSSIRDFP